MNYIHFRKNGDKQLILEAGAMISIRQDLACYFREFANLEDGITLRQFLKSIEHCSPTKFLNSTYSIAGMYEELHKAKPGPKSLKNGSGLELTHLAIRPCLNIEVEGDGTSFLDLEWRMYGVCAPSPADIKISNEHSIRKGQVQCFELDEMDFKEYLDMPLRIQNRAVVTGVDLNPGHEIYVKPPKLDELLHCVFSEITVFKAPTQPTIPRLSAPEPKQPSAKISSFDDLDQLDL